MCWLVMWVVLYDPPFCNHCCNTLHFISSHRNFCYIIQKWINKLTSQKWVKISFVQLKVQGLACIKGIHRLSNNPNIHFFLFWFNTPHPTTAGSSPNQMDWFSIHSIQLPCQSLVERVLISSERPQVLATENKVERRGLNNIHSSVIGPWRFFSCLYTTLRKAH